MQKQQTNEHPILFSASDLVNFLACEYLTAMDLKALDPASGLKRTVADESAVLIQEKGYAHEENYLKQLFQEGRDIANLSDLKGMLDTKLDATVHAMREGKSVIYQAALRKGNLAGYADFLRRIERPSKLGGWSYEVEDTKLARSPKAKFIIQLCFYSDLVALIQNDLPEKMHLALGNGEKLDFPVADYIHYYRTVRSKFLNFVESDSQGAYPEPCEHCDLCHWRELCKDRWEQDDHLNRVANIRKTQIKKLNAEGITTLAQLASLGHDRYIKGMNKETLKKLRTQAKLQHHKKTTHEDTFELLAQDSECKRGFYRIPEPDEGDLFFDMEGDPLEPGGLEYLFGVYYFDAGQAQFKDFWAHNRPQERLAFAAFMDFVGQWLLHFPDAHIYHYNHYEVTALKRLMSIHGTRENEVDNLLRHHKFVDLYRVVLDSMQVSEPHYSIKNLETFYMKDDPRTGEVQNAGASIVYYENWRNTDDQQVKAKLLESIRSYNEYDCRSTYELRQWLLTHRPADMPWFSIQNADADNQIEPNQPNPWEEKLADYRCKLLDNLPENRQDWTKEQYLSELVFFLLDFHRRADKPAWWKIFARQENYWSGNTEELMEDVDCIADMRLSNSHPPEQIRRSYLYTYEYPEQEIKFSEGDACIRIDTLKGVNKIEFIDEHQRLVKLKVGMAAALPDSLTISKAGPLSATVLKEALLRFADSYLQGEDRYQAILAFLRHDEPNIRGHIKGTPIIQDSRTFNEQSNQAVANLQNSYLFIQGPPGAGKTYTGSHMIIELLRQGKKVGVSALSHKAIINLLQSVEKLALGSNFTFSGIKKSDSNRPETHFNGSLILDVFDNNNIDITSADLIAGTAYLFARPEFDQQLDYLFVDEAGQIALANLVATATCALNIVLLGDQMQLGQPTQGVHPGDSGKSTLEYLLGNEATIAPEHGLFLETTWRMHEHVCRFISDAVYDGKLHPEPHNQNQRLVLRPDAHPALQATGIRFIPAQHEGCSQRSETEALIVEQLYQSLLQQTFVDRQGVVHSMTAEDILVLSPYNMQVNLLKSILPENARVGTVDKFQGQEAQVVILSMATSSGDDLPRNIEFLYSKNRLNVSISRAKCLALLVANPALLSIQCNTVEQMRLVNSLCWLKEYSESSA